MSLGRFLKLSLLGSLALFLASRVNGAVFGYAPFVMSVAGIALGYLSVRSALVRMPKVSGTLAALWGGTVVAAAELLAFSGGLMLLALEENLAFEDLTYFAGGLGVSALRMFVCGAFGGVASLWRDGSRSVDEEVTSGSETVHGKTTNAAPSLSCDERFEAPVAPSSSLPCFGRGADENRDGLPDGISLDEVHVPCPECHESTNSLKQIRYCEMLLFLGLAWAIRHRGFVGCPSCARRKLIVHGVINIVTANVLWPIIVLPWHLMALSETSKPGHSQEVRARLRKALATSEIPRAASA